MCAIATDEKLQIKTLWEERKERHCVVTLSSRLRGSGGKPFSYMTVNRFFCQ